MKRLLLLSLILIKTITGNTQENSFVSEFTSQLADFYKSKPNEKVFIQTDKLVYSPGETIWFKAWTIEEGTKLPLSKKIDLVVRLIDSDGKSVVSEVYPLVDGTAHGDIILDENCKKGNYFIVGILPSNKYPEQLNFTKIEINPIYSNTILYNIKADNILKLNYENKIKINACSVNGNPQKKAKIKCIINQGNSQLLEEILKTDDFGNAELVFKIPSNSNGESYIIKTSDIKGNWESSLILPSESDKINIKFYPEGGTIIPSVNTKVVFQVTNSLGIPVDIEGLVTDKQNKEILKLKTICKGFGIFSMFAAKDEKYKLKITSLLGKDQVFELPTIDLQGLSFSVIKNDNNFLYANIAFSDQNDHNIILMISSGNKIHLTSELSIKESKSLKIPLQDIQQGIIQVRCFSIDGILLSDRLVNISKNSGLSINLTTHKEYFSQNDSILLKINLKDLNGKPISGNVSLSISDGHYCDSIDSNVPFEYGWNSFLSNPLEIDNNCYSQMFENQRMLDYFLIANNLKFNFVGNKMISSGNAYKLNSDINFESLLSDFSKKKAKKYNTPTFRNIEFLSEKSLAKKKVISNNQKTDNNLKKYLESSTNLLDVIKNMHYIKMEGNKILFGTINSINFQGGALIVIDGQKVGEDASVLNSVNPSDVQDIKILTASMDVQRYTAFNPVGVIEITTKKGGLNQPGNAKVFSPINNSRYKISREFNQGDDFATTLYWNPDLRIDSTGLLVLKIPFQHQNSDLRIQVIGYGENGQYGNSTKLIKINKN